MHVVTSGKRNWVKMVRIEQNWLCFPGESWLYAGNKEIYKTVPEESQMLDLLDKDFKSAIENMFRESNKTFTNNKMKNSKQYHTK